MSKNIYTYNVKLNLAHQVFSDYDIKLVFKAALIEFDSQSFPTYKECVDDCSTVVNSFKKELEEAAKGEFVIGWEANPKRSKDSPYITEPDKWQDDEILHVFLFPKDTEVTSKTHPVISSTVNVSLFDEEGNLDLH